MIVSQNKTIPTPLNGDVISEPGPMPMSSYAAVAEQLEASVTHREGLAAVNDWRRSLLADGGQVADSTDATYESFQDDRGRNVDSVADNLKSFRGEGAMHSAAATTQYEALRDNLHDPDANGVSDWLGAAGGKRPAGVQVGPLDAPADRPAVDQFKGSQDPTAETDADGNGIPDVIDASIDTGAEHDRNNNGLLDVIESSGPVEARESEKITDLMDSLAVVDWDLDRDGVPDVMYLETVKSSTSGGVLDFSSAPADKPADLGIEPSPPVSALPKAKVGAGLTLPVKQSNAGGRRGRGGKEQKASRGR